VSTRPPGDRALHVGGRHRRRAHEDRIEEHVDLPLAPADELHLPDAVDRLEGAPQALVGELRRLADRVALRLQREVENRRRVGVELLDARLIDVLRQVGQDRVDLVAHVLRGDVDVLFEHERDDDLRDAFRRDRPELVDAADRVDRPFDLVGQLGLDLLGSRAVLRRRHDDRRKIDLRESIDPQ
jgi:hypothetical protein